MIGGLTVLTLVREAYEVKKGDWILVHAAAGGTGLILGQVLKDLGAHTIGTVSTAAKAKLAKEAGFEHVLETYDHDTVLSKVKELTNGEGVICVYDGVGFSKRCVLCVGWQRYLATLIRLSWSTREHDYFWERFWSSPSFFTACVVIKITESLQTEFRSVYPDKGGIRHVCN